MTKFKILTKGILPSNLCTAKNFELCPKMDLISFQLNSNTIWIYRLNNEKVWDLDLEYDDEKDESIAQLCWRPDGKLFAVISNLGKVTLFDAENGKPVISFHIGQSYNLHHVGVCIWSSIKIITDKIHKNSPYTELFDIHLKDSLVKLSDQNIAIDDEISLDDESSSTLDFLLVCSLDGLTSLVLSGVFTVENYQLPIENEKVVKIVSNYDLSSDFILTQNNNKGTFQIYRLNIKFVKKYGSKLPLISRSCSTLIGLLNGLQTHIEQMKVDHKPFADYTTRIIDLLKGEINENDKDQQNNDPVYDLYDLLLTGSLSNATKTWLTDYLGDRGIKRWLKLGKKHFEGSRKVLFYSIIPALQHILVHLTEFQGLSEWEETSELLGLRQEKIDSAIKITSSIMKSCYKYMMLLNEEQKNFESVMDWFGGIIQEVTEDEKPTKPIKTADIIDFLLSISNKSAMRHKDEEVKKLYTSLDSTLKQVFGDVKRKMREQMSSKIIYKFDSKLTQISSCELCMDDDSLIVTLCSRTKIETLVFNTTTEAAISNCILNIDNSTDNIQARSMNSSKEILTLVPHNASATLTLLQLSTESNSILSEKDVLTSIIDRMEITDNQNDNIATFLTNNPDRRSCALLDKKRKHYEVLEY
ncbi:hypothetical protein HII13_003302 [Brettanomyces bruxellensis]|uniref:Anaphase-promoting complex subunit 4 n=1 Tax=Dekkera bruxellensis TaxID=5007 RepID=A0A7D9CXC7_DEKBR|nr:hypothetical protein HII13_003302 [Brettanomyces bruxellensis]VUG18118.1 DEBR0S3_02696g1_1 [Brettanomyces bruxellensis]